MIPQVRYFYLLLFIIKCHGYQTSWNSDRRLQRIPQDVMVDVVNNLALKLLAIHNEGNDNNIAISPYGAVSVLVALKEGLRGNAAYEIQQAANIPSDLSVIRIGLRDIHRHLRSYFIPEEGFLSGLTLSHDNVTLNREYEDILKFYGFDINSFNNAVFGDLFTTTVATTTTEEVTTSTTNMPTTTTENMVPKEEITTQNDRLTRSEVTTTPTPSTTEMVMTTTVVPTTENVVTTTKSPPTTTTVLTTQVFTSNVVTTTQQVTTTPETTTTTEIKLNDETPEVTTTVKPTSIETTTTNEFKLNDETPKITTTVKPTSTEAITTTEFKLNDETEEVINDNVTTEAELTDTSATENDSSTNEIQDETTEYLAENETNDTLHRNTRSVVDYIIARYYDDHTITQRPPPYNSENDLYFLINGMYKESNINYMTYDTVLPFHYIPHLNTLALRFPLDSARYYLLLLLPENPQNINKLICDLRLNGNLKYIINNLRYTHVKAIIPSFMLKGYVVLTPTLQKMGIRQVFEPRQADFSQMTPDRNIYVTNIEQAITVNIRNYVDPITMNNNRYLQRNNPVLFRADHPFLYFVMDSEIDVTLMMGKIVNPLNSRIR
ncbi:leukocyte elastase inhibitor [Tribolium castaneum]|uniref:Serpin peptidase inhibitor 6 n=1 Tax=Tribolium castaneum TaxID=7070 RepID=D7EK08_TRICA|nr:PREDICTED: leukocyte elastase inhibitor [Tribolium castaneum]EFA12955.2 serpin peptidase inhibitor 6 [Tribolium castaneum]|eukprot:XP_967786.3 PREDICTED: leukocyte elastase inhibitor [Tribolium castaneum]